jgi:hypothetical protein
MRLLNDFVCQRDGWVKFKGLLYLVSYIDEIAGWKRQVDYLLLVAKFFFTYTQLYRLE